MRATVGEDLEFARDLPVPALLDHTCPDRSALIGWELDQRDHLGAAGQRLDAAQVRVGRLDLSMRSRLRARSSA